MVGFERGGWPTWHNMTRQARAGQRSFPDAASLSASMSFPLGSAQLRCKKHARAPWKGSRFREPPPAASVAAAASPGPLPSQCCSALHQLRLPLTPPSERRSTAICTELAKDPQWVTQLSSASGLYSVNKMPIPMVVLMTQWGNNFFNKSNK